MNHTKCYDSHIQLHNHTAYGISLSRYGNVLNIGNANQKLVTNAVTCLLEYKSNKTKDESLDSSSINSVGWCCDQK